LPQKRVIIAGLVVSLAISAILLAYHIHRGLGATYTRENNNSTLGATKPRCAIIDGLSEAYPNDYLLRSLESMLKKAGCIVDVYRGPNASLDVFKRLTDYTIVVMRIHGGFMGKGQVAGIFTGVPWSRKYVTLARKGYVAEGIPFYPPPRGPKVFVALLPKFFAREMKGRFPSRAIVIAGGCFTAKTTAIAESLCSKGLWLYIGFPKKIMLNRLDKVLPKLLSAAIDARKEGDISVIEKLGEQVGAKVINCAKNSHS